MDVLALSANEIAMAAVALAFVTFALVCALVVPRYRPEFPGRGGLGVFILATVLFFLATMAAVLVLGKEAETHAETQVAETVEEAETETGEEEVAPEIAETGTIQVSATEYRFDLDETAVGPGRYRFELTNDGTVGHNLVIEGEGLDKAETPVIDPGKEAVVEATFEQGTYELYCSVPGHRDAGMEFELAVG